MPDHVFAYGSLVAAPNAVPCRLRGHRRTWGVAMDNAHTVPGYKVYRDGSGEQPDVCVAFLDVVAAERHAVTGACLPAPDLGALDERERNYRRVDVTHLIDGDDLPSGRIWVYTGLRASRARARRARDAGRLVVPRGYLRLVEAALGERVPPPTGVPVRALRRVDVPDEAAA